MDLIKRALITNKKFEIMYESYKKKYKPSNLIKVISYEYNNIGLLQKINGKFAKAIIDMTNDYKKAISNSKETLDGSLLSMDKSALQMEILNMIEAPKDVKSIEESYITLKNKVRGKKAELSITPNDANKYEAALYDTKNFTDEANKRLKTSKDSVTTIKHANTAVGAMNSNISEIYSKSTRYLGNINVMYAAYVSFCKMEFLMRSEYSFAARLILKRLYRMP